MISISSGWQIETQSAIDKVLKSLIKNLGFF